MQNPRQYKIPDWFLNRQKDVKDGKYSQVSGWVGDWVNHSADGPQRTCQMEGTPGDQSLIWVTTKGVLTHNQNEHTHKFNKKFSADRCSCFFSLENPRWLKNASDLKISTSFIESVKQRNFYFWHKLTLSWHHWTCACVRCRCWPTVWTTSWEKTWRGWRRSEPIGVSDTSGGKRPAAPVEPRLISINH